MKKIDLGQAVTILANIGVIAGISLLVFELNQNRQTMQTQARASLAQLDMEQIRSLRLDEALMQQIVDQSQAYESIDEFRFWLWIRESTRVAEHQFYQFRVGALGDSEFEGAKSMWKRIYSSSTYREWWDANKADYSTEFQREFDELLSED